MLLLPFNQFKQLSFNHLVLDHKLLPHRSIKGHGAPAMFRGKYKDESEPLSLRTGDRKYGLRPYPTALEPYRLTHPKFYWRTPLRLCIFCLLITVAETSSCHRRLSGPQTLKHLLSGPYRHSFPTPDVEVKVGRENPVPRSANVPGSSVL